MSISLAHAGLPAGTSAYKLISLVEDVAQYPKHFAKLSRTAVALFGHLVRSYRPDDFSAGRICGTWLQPETIADALGISVRSYHYAEKELRKAKLIEQTSKAHARRAGERNAKGMIIWLYGLSLRPAIERYAELICIRDSIQLEKQALRLIKHEIKQVTRQIRERAHAGTVERAEAILPRGRTSRIMDQSRLEQIKIDLEALLVCVDDRTGDAKAALLCAETCAPDIPREDSMKNRSDASTPEQLGSADMSITPERAAGLASEDYRDVLSSLGGASWANLVEASAIVCHWHAIAQQVWGEACQIMGRERAALCVLIIDRNRRLPPGHRYHRQHASASLSGMIRLGNGKLKLTSLLKAMEGYPEKSEADIALTCQPPIRRANKGTHSLGSLVPGLLAGFRKQATGDEQC